MESGQHIEETVDEAVRVFGLEDKIKSSCVTDKLRLVGSDGCSRNMFIGLIQTVSTISSFSRFQTPTLFCSMVLSRM